MESLRSESEVSGSPRVTARLGAEAVAVLHAALEQEIGRRMPTSSPGLSDAIRRICLDAKRNAWPPESLLVAFKAALHSVPALQGLTSGPDRDAVVARLVSLCIDEYYRT
jgi:hypothetical protein